MLRYLATRPKAGEGGDGPERRLLCFHHAGAGAMTFAGWRQRIGTGVTVLPVRLPGRESLLREPPFTDADRLIEELTKDLGPLLDVPYAFYGHSLGALVAHRLALHLVAEGRRPPEVVLVGACPAPHLPSRLLEAAARPGVTDEQLVGLLADEDSVPELLLGRPEWLRATLPTLRADLRLARGLRSVRAEPLPCPLWAFAGRDDRMVGIPEVRAWERCTTSRFRFRTMPGAHFFVRGRELPLAVGAALHAEMPLPHVG
ncbi:alpha/beta fold hydrolase [Streptomyces niveiscabiei]|uniref:thioesterase II family protein n=1 Tax=Streptomyces niveiscabiei TaxID=164115 RepID=UPI0029A3FB96|nr:thioesterase domain-containing protein [Streptomyces niveiscabiei]MDX3380083.1 alpha/beta fold hydrolase [Streptomyces niveiscabiei]